MWKKTPTNQPTNKQTNIRKQNEKSKMFVIQWFCHTVSVTFILQINNYDTLPDVCTVWYLGHDNVGCYHSNYPIRSLVGTDPILDGSYRNRKSPIAKCAVAAIRAGYRMFAVQNGGRCVASATAPQTFDKYGKSTACKADGEGGQNTYQVYIIKGNQIIMLTLILSLCQHECTECKGLIDATVGMGFRF